MNGTPDETVSAWALLHTISALRQVTQEVFGRLAGPLVRSPLIFECQPLAEGTGRRRYGA